MNVIRISKQAWLITVTNHSPINHSKLAQSFSKLINLKLIISWVSATDINSQRLCVDGLLMYFDHSWIFHMERHHQRKCRAMSWKSRDTQKKSTFPISRRSAMLLVGSWMDAGLNLMIKLTSPLVVELKGPDVLALFLRLQPTPCKLCFGMCKWRLGVRPSTWPLFSIFISPKNNFHPSTPPRKGVRTHYPHHFHFVNHHRTSFRCSLKESHKHHVQVGM